MLDVLVAGRLDKLQNIIKLVVVLHLEFDVETSHEIAELDFLATDMDDLALGVVVG